MADLNLLEAWQLWASGQPTVGNDLYGIPVIWWGRIGKIVAAASSFVVVLDIIGPGPLKRLGERVRSTKGRRGLAEKLHNGVSTGLGIALAVVLVMLFGQRPGVLGWVVIVVVGLVLSSAMTTLTERLVPSVATWLGNALENGLVSRIALTVSLALFLVGFLLDLLAS